jgi:hypothetical protein
MNLDQAKAVAQRLRREATGNNWKSCIDAVDTINALVKEIERLTNVGFNGLTEAETLQTASVMGLTKVDVEPHKGCACRWDADDNRVATCVRHQGWLDVVQEWADRAKDAESALAALKFEKEHYRDQWSEVCNDNQVLRTQLAEAQAERDLHYNRCASLLFSEVLRDTTTGDIRKWMAEYVDAKADAARLREAIRAHLESSNNDDSAGDTWAGLEAALKGDV